MFDLIRPICLLLHPARVVDDLRPMDLLSGHDGGASMGSHDPEN